MPEDKNNPFTTNTTPDETVQPVADQSTDQRAFEQEAPVAAPIQNSSVPTPEVEPTTAQPVVDAQGTAPHVSSEQPGTQPVVQSAPTPFAPQPPQKSKKKWIIAGVASFVGIVLIGGGAFAYTMYQSPQKLLGDAVSALYQARATSGIVSYAQTKSGDTKVDIEFSTASVDSQYDLTANAKISTAGTSYDLKGAAVYDKDGNIYFKLSGVADALSKAASGQLPAEVKTIVEKYENKWVKVTASDLRDFSPEAEKAQKCYKELNQKLSQASFQKDIAKTYQSNQFVVIKDELGVKDGNVGYQIDVDTKIADEFEKQFKKTASYNELKSICDGTLMSDSSSSSDTSDDKKSDKTKVNVWISQWGHKLEKLEVKSSENDATLNAEVKFDYSKSVKVDVPKDTVSIKQLIEDFSSLYASTYSAAGTSSVNSSAFSETDTQGMESSALLNRFF